MSSFTSVSSFQRSAQLSTKLLWAHSCNLLTSSVPKHTVDLSFSLTSCVCACQDPSMLSLSLLCAKTFSENCQSNFLSGCSITSEKVGHSSSLHSSPDLSLSRISVCTALFLCTSVFSLQTNKHGLPTKCPSATRCCPPSTSMMAQASGRCSRCVTHRTLQRMSVNGLSSERCFEFTSN